ncbi:hypothetical protein G0Q06_01365 [Puniceicoccales bacterium CK1056]|uniref:Uncharacterized protein n=1 Tax=Oceanipulchritudo coccoides TaxID=2706888 RepID=A0A6B2LX60_9BACT|nr:hypothetical protein [Oceanipulchritudo coccoides]NDV61091.1 hypothetical protein [Oceanipulchritudo coccoides]
MLTLSIKHWREILRGFRCLKISKTTLPVLTYVRVLINIDTVTVTGTDLGQTVTYQLPRTGEMGIGEFLVPIKDLQAALSRRSAKGILGIEAGPEKGTFHIEEDGSVSRIPFATIDAVEFPEPSPLGEQVGGLVVHAVQQLAPALACASQDPTREILNAVRVEPEAVVATDGWRLFHAEGRTGIVEAFSLPASVFLQEFDTTKPVAVYRNDEHVQSMACVQGPWTYRWQVPVGQFPNWSAVVPKHTDAWQAVTFSKDDLHQLTVNLAKLPSLSGKNAPAGLLLRNGEVALWSGDGEERQFHPLAPLSRPEHGQFWTAFNFGYVHQALNWGATRLCLKDALSPLVLRGENREWVVMPLRMEEPQWPATLEKPRLVTREAPTHPRPVRHVARVAKPVVANVAVSEEEPQQAAEELVAEASRVREALKGIVRDLSALMKLGKDVLRERAGLKKEHAALKRSLKQLREINI